MSLGNLRKVGVGCVTRLASSDPGAERALLHGWLKEVNWDKGTAQLHDVLGGYTRLAFDSALSLDMPRLATNGSASRWIRSAERLRGESRSTWRPS